MPAPRARYTKVIETVLVVNSTISRGKQSEVGNIYKSNLEYTTPYHFVSGLASIGSGDPSQTSAPSGIGTTAPSV